MDIRILFATMLSVLITADATAAAEPDFERAQSLGKRTEGKVFRDKVEVHFGKDTKEAWYWVNGAAGREYFKVELETGKISPMEQKDAPPIVPRNAKPVRERRSRAGGPQTSLTFANETKDEAKVFWLDMEGKRQPYGIVPVGGEVVMTTFAGHLWLVTDSSGAELGKYKAEPEQMMVVIGGEPSNADAFKSTVVPVKPKWTVELRDHNIWLKEGDRPAEQLTTDGSSKNRYDGPFQWSPDGKLLAAFRVEPATNREVTIVESSPPDQLQPKVKTMTYPKPGDEIDHPRVVLFDPTLKKQIPVSDALFPNPWSLSDARWTNDSKSLRVLYNQRGHQVLRLLSVDASSGAVRVIAEEAPKTFVDYTNKVWYADLPGQNELIWMSERDGWNHLYLVETATGQIKTQITKGNWMVRKVLKMDTEKKQLWFTAMGVRPGQDPYYKHLCRVNFDGTGFAVLTESDGSHEWDFSPDGRYFVDRWSRVDQPTVTELRSCADGKLIAELARGDFSELSKTGWHAPERFVAKGRDGVTDIYGIICRPTNFDPNKKYPVVEKIYAGPHDSFVPKEFRLMTHDRALSELGIILVQIDGMGTNWRGKAFHDVCFKNLQDAGFLDRIAWMKAAAAKYPFLDLSRVGIYGGSAGGQNALRALIDHGDFYKAAVADCGCHDNRMDKIWWNEQWMSWPVGKEYELASNVVHANRMKGELLLTWGELDNNVDPASSMQVVNALIKANKEFEMFVVPGGGHGIGESTYLHRKRMGFFHRTLAVGRS